MRCFSCGKEFSYEKYYGICPRCGTFNRENVQSEQDSTGTFRDWSESGKKKRKKGKGIPGLLASGLLLAFGILLMWGILPAMEKREEQRIKDWVTVGEVPVEMVGMEEYIELEDYRVAVMDCRLLDEYGDSDMQKGTKLIAVRIAARTLHADENYNYMESPYLLTGEQYRYPVDQGEFFDHRHNYSLRRFDLDFLNRLKLEVLHDAWLIFQTEEENTEGIIYFEYMDRSEDVPRLEKVYGVSLTFDKNMSELEEME